MTSKTQEFRLSNQSDDLDWVVGLFYQEREEGWDFETMTVDYRNSLGYANQMASVATYLPDRLPVAPTDVWWASYDRTTLGNHGCVSVRSTIDLMKKWNSLLVDVSLFVKLIRLTG